MNESHSICSEKYAELCALSTSGDLTAEEMSELNTHLGRCPTCAVLHREYTSIAQVGMAKLAAELGRGEERLYLFRQRAAERRFEQALREPTEGISVLSGQTESANSIASFPRRGRRFAIGLGIAAALLFATGAGVEIGRRLENPLPKLQPIAASPSTPSQSSQERDALETQLASVQKSLVEVQSRAAEAEKRIADLTNARKALTTEMDQLTESSQATSDSLAAVTQQRDGLEQQLSEANKTLNQAKADLVAARLDRKDAVLKATSLEQEVNDLHATLTSSDKVAASDEQFLAKDRDIRELMGARQLYIADVLDVQHDGQRSKPFGRVFYTKGKSLVFYAFDLQSQPSHEAKTFQAWGRPDGGSSKPISLGIFYMDSEQNKRWVLKSANPDVLARINAVFVTVEPKGGSQEPTGKPFLEAYLHSLPPNHP